MSRLIKISTLITITVLTACKQSNFSTADGQGDKSGNKASLLKGESTPDPDATPDPSTSVTPAATETATPIDTATASPTVDPSVTPTPTFAAIKNGWYPNKTAKKGTRCSAVCSALGLVLAPAPGTNSKCASGEVRPTGSITATVAGAPVLAAGDFFYGTWGTVDQNGEWKGAIGSTESGDYCYASGQKHDTDKTDITVGCYCQEAG